MIDDGEEIHDGHHHAHGNQVVAFLCLREYCAVGHYGADVFPIIATIDTLLLHSHKTGNIQDCTIKKYIKISYWNASILPVV